MWTREEIEELYRTHGFSVKRRCRHLLGSEAEAADMVQEVFVRALENPAAFGERSRASTYLFGVATNLCLNRIRNGAARGDSWQAAVTAQMESRPVSEPGARIECEQLVRLLLAEADEVTASMALYHWVDGLSQGEIAALVGLSRVTVNQRLGALRERALALREATR